MKIINTKPIEFLCIAIFPFFANAVHAASTREAVWQQVEVNNTELSILRADKQASQAENYVGTHLANPEFETGFLWDVANDNASKTTLALSQELDLSVISGRTKKNATSQSALHTYEYQIEKQNKKDELNELLDEIVFSNHMMDYKKELLGRFEQIYRWGERSFHLGETSRLEWTKLRLSFLEMKMSYSKDSLDRIQLLNRLTEMNGGNPVAVDSDLSYDFRALPNDFPEWFDMVSDSIPMLVFLKSKETSSDAAVRLASSAWWPKFTVGYQSELSDAEKLHGFNVGLALPLWENKGLVKSAKLRNYASREERNLNCEKIKNEMLHRYQVAQVMKSIYEEMLTATDDIRSDEEMLQKAVKVGEISMLDYLSEIASLFDIKIRMIEYEYEYQKSKTAFFSGVQD